MPKAPALFPLSRAVCLVALTLPALPVLAQDRTCAREFVYAGDLVTQAQAGATTGNCSGSISQLDEAEREWARLSTLESCSPGEKGSAARNLAAARDLRSSLLPRCTSYVEWKGVANLEPRKDPCSAEMDSVTQAHLKAMSLARTPDCEGAVALFDATERRVTALSERTTCSAEAHEWAVSDMHRIRFDMRILRTRYCPNVERR